jgi:DNA-binding NtrC family response regulator
MARILVIDDDLHMRTACARALARAGHSVTCAETGEDGLRAIGSGPDPYDAVLLDQLMPGLSGRETLAVIKAKAPRLPVIIITGSETEETAAEILEQGACDCLSKPFNPEQLRNAIRKALASVLIGD